tara:strand:+ start:128 stop:442 length:315 start_codon:yes stop_codon:yes gene_type:complete
MHQINIATLLLISMLSTAKAEDIPDYADSEFGEYLSSQCVTCHKNNSSKGIPAIAGKDYHYLVSLLEGYRSKELKNNVMRLQAGNLSDEEIASLSLYFSKLKLD